jgi:hypothetical protein
MVKKNVGSVANQGMLRRIAGKDRLHPKMIAQKKQMKLI